MRLAGTLRDLALSPDGNTLVVASESPDQITLIDTRTRHTLGTTAVGAAPGPLVILPDNSKVFIADSGEKKVSIASLPDGRLFGHLELDARLNTLLLKPDGGEIFALGSDFASTMMIIDAYHDNVEKTFPFGSNPVAGVFRRDMSLLYIANAGDGSVQTLDVQTREVVASTHIGMSPAGARFDARREAFGHRRARCVQFGRGTGGLGQFIQ